MTMARIAALLFAFAGVVFLGVGMSRSSDGERNVVFLILGVVFLLLAAVRLLQSRVKPPVSTDPRLPARKTQKPGT
jgi:hypothetical protein